MHKALQLLHIDLSKMWLYVNFPFRVNKRKLMQFYASFTWALQPVA